MSKAENLIGSLKTLVQSNHGREANGMVYFDQLRTLPSMSKDDERAYSTLLHIHFPGANVEAGHKSLARRPDRNRGHDQGSAEYPGQLQIVLVRGAGMQVSADKFKFICRRSASRIR